MGRSTSGIYSFSHSEMAVYKDCRRKWMMQYYWKLRRRREPKSKARDTGILVHAALHQFYTNGGLDGARSKEVMYGFLDTARDEDLLKVDETDRPIVVDTHVTAKIILDGYIEWLHETGADVGYRFDHSEVELRAPGPIEGTELMGIIDLGGREQMSGDLFVMDTKVTNSISDMVKSLHMIEQGPMYALLAKLNDPDEHRGFRVVWNMLKRNKQTPRARPPFYQRYELAINDDQLRQFYAQLEGQIADILRTEERLNAGEPHIQVAYPTPSGDCSWKCPYFTVCGAMNDMKRNDVDFLIQSYFTTPEQRDAAKVESQQAEDQIEGAESPFLA
jgi:PD-(D/E)XK nuclease superfamily